MKLDDVEGDDSLVEDLRGRGGGGGGLGGLGGLLSGKGGKVGIPGIIILVVGFLISQAGGGGGAGTDITDVLGQMTGQAPAGQVAPPAPGEGATEDAQYQFIAKVGNLLDTYWTESFQESGQDYRSAKIRIFDAPTPTGCGTGRPETGPFYCPADDYVYIDFGFYEQLERQLGFDGDFAMAYVIAHEWGHHIQNVLGINEEVQDRSRDASQEEANALSVKLELQADCFAGVWAKSAYEDDRGLLESGDLEEAIDAAGAVGDDRIQERTQGRINPESFTHGSAAERQRWFRTGFDTADPSRCDTFS